MEKVCPTCGKSSKEIEFVGEFCKECFLNQRKQKIPKFVEIKKCKKCGRIKIGNEWFNEEEKIEEAISKGIGLMFELKELNNNTAHGFVYINGDKLEVSIKIKFVKILCKEDLLKSSRYYEAKVQLRGSNEDVKKLEKEIERNLKNTYILEKKENKNGVDLLIGSRKEIEKVLKFLGLKALRTFSLVGMKDGKRVYRATYLVRCGNDEAKDN